MSNRAYRFSLGFLLLVAMYFNLKYMMWAIIGIVFVEGITNLRVPKLVNRLRGVRETDPNEGTLAINFKLRFNVEAEQIWRITVASLLFLSYVLFYDQVWFLPWFMSFAIFGAGISGVCPIYLFIKWLGFK